MESSHPIRPQNPPLDVAPRRYTDAGTFVDAHGYVWEWCPSHPTSHRGVVLQHRLVMECSLGRFLSKRERVHHKDHCPWNNQIENLQLYESHRQHMVEHWQNSGRRTREVIQAVRRAAA